MPNLPSHEPVYNYARFEAQENHYQPEDSDNPLYGFHVVNPEAETDSEIDFYNDSAEFVGPEDNPDVESDAFLSGLGLEMSQDQKKSGSEQDAIRAELSFILSQSHRDLVNLFANTPEEVVSFLDDPEGETMDEMN